mmetsp:Transcript_51872/g.112470  ORF Transcript_51872/g.112470 Transcript_51872/m.112470 type:complete len:96 (-) Transcript_51872:1582-1869(-)
MRVSSEKLPLELPGDGHSESCFIDSREGLGGARRRATLGESLTELLGEGEESSPSESPLEDEEDERSGSLDRALEFGFLAPGLLALLGGRSTAAT